MKAQFILAFLLASVVSVSAFATRSDQKQNTITSKEFNTPPDQERKEKKTKKSKYGFNIFKLYSIALEKQRLDSLSVDIKARRIEG